MKESKQMLSVIIPVYNVDKYLVRCVESIIRQTYTDWEIILVDDGSTDNSGYLCDSFSKHDSRIKSFHQKNQGVSAARNKGIEEAKGSHIIFIDSDDWIEPNMFSLMMTNNYYDMVACGFNRITVLDNGESNIDEIDPWPEKKQGEIITRNFFCEILCRTGTLWNKVIKKDLIDTIRFDCQHSYGEDTVFLANALKSIKTVKILKNPLYNYLINRQGNVVSASIDKRILNYLNNAKIIYDEALVRTEPQSGVYKIQMTVWDVFNKIPNWRDKQYKEYIRECIVTLRYPSIEHIIFYVFGKEKYDISLGGKMGYLLYFIIPHIMIFLRKMRKNGIVEKKA